MAEPFTIETAQQFINELAEEKNIINVCDVNQNSAPVKMIDLKHIVKQSASPADIRFARLVAELVKGRFELPITIKVFKDLQNKDILGLKYEALVYKFILKNILEPRFSPNFVSFVSYGCCNDNRCYLMTEKVGSGAQFGKNKLFPVQPFYKLYPTLNLRDQYKILFQVVYSLEVMAKFKMVHNDLHDSNILITILDEPIVLKYLVENKVFVIRTKHIPYIFDWDYSFVESLGKNEKLTDPYFYSEHNIRNVFEPMQDIYILFCHIGARHVDESNTVVSTYSKNPLVMAKEYRTPIIIQPSVKERIQYNFRPTRVVKHQRIYKLSANEFQTYVGKDKAPPGIGDIYFFFNGFGNIEQWNPYECRMTSDSKYFPVPRKLLKNNFKMFETEKEVDTPFVYRLPTNEEVQALIKEKIELSNPISEQTPVIEADGTQKWLKNGLLHRDNDLPALIKPDGTKGWYQHGKLHRDNDRPAGTGINGEQEWWQNGERHRDNDLPAIDIDGNKEWYQHGELHRDNDLPAIIDENGAQEWYQRGKLHRDNDRPAIIHANGAQEWYQNGELHRDNDLPAITDLNGTQEWYQHGLQHRDNDLPAHISTNSQQWWQNGELHRDNDLPAGILGGNNGDKWWYQHGKLHRDNDLPAVIEKNGTTQEWWQNGELHRENGPAIIKADGTRKWYKNGQEIYPPSSYPGVFYF